MLGRWSGSTSDCRRVLLVVAAGETALHACRAVGLVEVVLRLVRLRERWVIIPLGATGDAGRGLHFLLWRLAGAASLILENVVMGELMVAGLVGAVVRSVTLWLEVQENLVVRYGLSAHFVRNAMGGRCRGIRKVTAGD